MPLSPSLDHLLNSDLLSLIPIQDESIFLTLVCNKLQHCTAIQDATLLSPQTVSSHPITPADYVFTLRKVTTPVHYIHLRFKHDNGREQQKNTLDELSFFLDILYERLVCVDEASTYHNLLDHVLSTLRPQGHPRTLSSEYSHVVKEVAHEINNAIGLLHFNIASLLPKQNTLHIDPALIAVLETHYALPSGTVSQLDLATNTAQLAQLKPYPLLYNEVKKAYEQRRFSNTITTVSKTIETTSLLIETLLNYGPSTASAATQGSHLEPIINDILLLFKDRLQSNRISVVYTPSSTAHLVTPASIHLFQILINLVKNSIASMHFTTKKVLTLTVTSTSTSCLLALSDTGSGLKTSPKKATRRTGLGIPISQDIAKRYGASIHWHSSDHGTTTTLHLPLTPEPT